MIPTVGEVVADIFDALIKLVLGPVTDWIAAPFIRWLVNVPNYANARGSSTKMHEHLEVVTWLSFGLIAAVMTLAALHYWASGLATGSSDGTGLEAIQRAVGAALFITAWPWIYHNAVEVANAASKGLVQETGLGDAVATLGVESEIPGVGPILMVLIAVTFFIVVLGMVLIKIGLSVGLAVLFIGMPLAVALWILPSTAWIAHLCLRSFTAILIIPVVWGICIRALAVIGADVHVLADGVSFLDGLVGSLTAVVGWFMLIKLAQLVLRSAGVLPGGGGGLQHAMSFLAAHLAFNAMAAHLPDSVGGKATSRAEQQADRESRLLREGTRDAQRSADKAARSVGPGSAIEAQRGTDRAHRAINAERERDAQVGGEGPRTVQEFDEAFDKAFDRIDAARAQTRIASQSVRESHHGKWHTWKDPAEPAYEQAAHEYREWLDANDLGQGERAMETLRRANPTGDFPARSAIWNGDEFGNYENTTNALGEYARDAGSDEVRDAYNILRDMDGPSRLELAGGSSVEIVEEPPKSQPPRSEPPQ